MAGITIAFLLIANGCGLAISQPPAADRLDLQYAIYSVMVERVFARETLDTVYVHEKTSSFGSGGRHDSVPRRLCEIPSVSTELIDAYVAANTDTLQLEADRFRTETPIVVTSSSPGEVKIYLSRIGFSADGSEAVIHYILRCGSRCGAGYVTRLENSDGRWIVREGLPTIIF